MRQRTGVAIGIHRSELDRWGRLFPRELTVHMNVVRATRRAGRRRVRPMERLHDVDARCGVLVREAGFQDMTWHIAEQPVPRRVRAAAHASASSMGGRNGRLGDGQRRKAATSARPWAGSAHNNKGRTHSIIITV